MIEFVNVTKVYEGGVVALSNANIKIENGEFVFLVGSRRRPEENDCHKADYAGGKRHRRGNLLVCEKTLRKFPARKSRICGGKWALCFRISACWRTGPVYENVRTLRCRLWGCPGGKSRRRVPNVLNQVGLNYKAKMFPAAICPAGSSSGSRWRGPW